MLYNCHFIHESMGHKKRQKPIVYLVKLNLLNFMKYLETNGHFSRFFTCLYSSSFKLRKTYLIMT